MAIISTTVGRNPVKKWSSHHGQQKSLKCSTWMQSQKQQNDLCSFPRQTIQYHGNPTYAPTSNAEEAEGERFYEGLQDLLELTPKKDVLFIIGDWNSKVGRQETPGVTGKFDLGVQNEAGRRQADFWQVNTVVIANTLFQQCERGCYTWTLPDGRYWNQISYVPWSQAWRNSIRSAKARPGADCGSDHQLLIAKFRFKSKTVGENHQAIQL